ncbi:MAG: helicase-exonuclease AddAB subunit AddA [Defluviitaleaceae bacterium]|nr:helicase-exonuclease AddAB subunit AddA [Defluviitaleaceae bacterium]MCL2836846.1 helicase-exonuclease AddAB subunit AddA [Defluviitaleaceae bacterium]
MSERIFTDEQNAAITTRGCDLLVSAAAGSGKTAVLVERVIKMVTDKTRPVDMSRFLVVTFTDAAAAEMRARIREALSGLLRAEPGNNWLRSQESQLNDASIMTIHAFCGSVIRRYFHLTGIDPFYTVADQQEAELMKRDVLDELLEEMYSNNAGLNTRVLGEDGNALFLELVEIYGGHVTDDALGDQILRLHDYACGEPWPEKWLKWAGTGDSAVFEDTAWYRFLMDDARDSLEDALEAAKKAATLASSFLLHEKYISAVDNDARLIEKCLEAWSRGWDALYEALDFEFERLSAAKVKNLSGDEEEQASDLKEQIRGIRDKHVKLPINTLKKRIFLKPKDETITDLRISERAVNGLCGLAAELRRRFTDAKSERNILDFNDLEHECVKILLDDEGGLSGAAAELAERYEEIFIDEYQDSNAVQELLLSCISGAPHGRTRNTFMVGDVKQSIYRFRLADPEIFNAKYNSFRTENYANQRLVILTRNFRSRRAVLDAVNLVFSQIASSKLGGTDYRDDESLHFGAEYYSADEERHVTEVICVDTGNKGFDNDESPDSLDFAELSKMEKEAAVAALRIKELLDEPFMVDGRDGTPRPMRASDIAILLRSPRDLADIYVRALKDLGIFAESEAASGYFETPEVLVALSFLRVIDNPRQDIPLTAALYSRVYGLTASELLRIRQSNGGQMYNAARLYLENGADEDIKSKLGRFFTDLKRWRGIAAAEGVSALLQAVLEESGLMLFEGVSSGGAIRQANLRALHAYAIGYEKTRMRGLFNFIRFVDRIIKTGKDSGVKPAKDEGTDAVKIMSIHKSKGLEFPVALVCGLGRKFNLRDTQGRLLLHNNLGIGTGALDLTARVHSDTPKRMALSAKLRQESISEELRVLYVAMTRAREKLILIGETKKDPADVFAQAIEYSGIKLPYRLLKKNLCFMDFILQALARQEYAGGRIKVICPPVPDIPAHESISLPPLEEFEETAVSRPELADMLFYEYPHAKAAFIPRKLSVTEVKRLYYSEQVRESGHILPESPTPLPSPAFMSSVKNFSAAERGTIFHMILERLPLSATTAAEVKALISSLVSDRFLNAEEAATVDINKIERYLTGALAGRIRTAERVWREQGFTISVPAGDINPDWIGQDGEIMVHGVIDCVFMENGKLTLVDYKTGRFTDAENEWKRYQPQMALYARAIKEYFGTDASESLMYYFDNGVTLNRSCAGQ